MSVPTYDKQYINGEWVASTHGSAGNLIDVWDSNTGEVCAKVISGSTTDTENAIEAAAAAFDSWSRTPLEERKALVGKIVAEFMKRKQDVADALQKELGAPKLFAENVQAMMFPFHMGTAVAVADQVQWSENLGNSLIVKEPIGVVGAITPWNWPLNQIACKVGPALAAGCTIVLKPSEVTPINAYILTEAIHAAGLPRGVFNMVCGDGPNCGEVLATHPLVDMVSFTGSTAVGRKLHALGAATIKRGERPESLNSPVRDPSHSTLR
jgi:aldehyde dehydrogenase (NAD+)